MQKKAKRLVISLKISPDRLYLNAPDHGGMDTVIPRSFKEGQIYREDKLQRRKRYR
jgi:hypothetical protein